MTPEQLVLLNAELLNDPTQQGYGPHIPDASGVLAEMLNKVGASQMKKSAMYTARGLLADMDLAKVRTLLTCLKAVATQDPVVEVAYDALRTQGMDLAHPNIGLMLGQFVALNLLPQDVADAVEALTMQSASRAEAVLGTVGATVTAADVRSALEV